MGGRRSPLRRQCAGLCSRAPPVRLHHRDRSLRSHIDAAQGSPGICSSSAGRPRRRIPTSPAGRAQSRRFPVRTMSPSIRLATCGLPPTAPLLRYPKADGLFRVLLEGADRGHVVQFLAVPFQAETCGPVIHDRHGSVFVCVQHPGEEGSWHSQLSFFPDYVPSDAEPARGAWRGPRPSVVQVTRDAG